MAYVLSLPIGLVVGLLLGTLGGGGAILAVPALVYLLGQSPSTATFASLVIVVIGASAGLLAHWRAGRVRVGAGVGFAAAGLVGSFLGSRVSLAVNPNVLLLGFAALMLVIAAVMVWRQRTMAAPAPPAAVAVAAGRVGTAAAPVERDTGTTRPEAGADAGQRGTSVRRGLVFAGTASGIGFLTGLFGVGGGIIVVPTLVLALGFTMPVAVGTSLVVIILNSLAAIVARLGSGGVTLDWLLIAVFAGSAVVGALAGNRIAERIDTRRLTRAFVGLIVVVAVYITIRSLPPLL
jgi:uncharacterized membrane protein YfcA